MLQQVGYSLFSKHSGVASAQGTLNLGSGSGRARLTLIAITCEG